jgi:hypothetical protein
MGAWNLLEATTSAADSRLGLLEITGELMVVVVVVFVFLPCRVENLATCCKEWVF